MAAPAVATPTMEAAEVEVELSTEAHGGQKPALLGRLFGSLCGKQSSPTTELAKVDEPPQAHDDPDEPDGIETDASKKDIDGDRPSLDRKVVWGLYCMYALVGLINGFFSNFINIPICQYVFGPMGDPGRSQVQQCNVATSVYQMPWNFKVFYAILLDRISFFGSRRRGWINFGWTMALLFMLVLAFMAEGMADAGNFSTYSLMVMVLCVFYMFSDVAGDGMTIELTKFESAENRGYILTTGQMVRFVFNVASNFIGMFAMNGKSYYPKEPSPDDVIFPFELSFGWVHVLLVALALPFWILMVLWLRDPPREKIEEHQKCSNVARELWGTMQTKALLFLVIQSIGTIAIAGMSNPATNIIASIASPSTFQSALGNTFGMILFLIGVWIFRTWFMNRNWRLTFLWTSFLLLSNLGFNLLVIYDAWGVGQTGWFYAISGSLPLLLQGIQQVLSSLAVAEISPEGSEATVYEFLTTCHNSAIALSANLMNIFMPVFNLNSINGKSYDSADSAQQAAYDSQMAGATYMTMAVNIAGVLIFMWFLPASKEMTKEWLEDKTWHRPSVGVLALVIAAAAFVFSTLVSFLSLFPETDCLPIAGGEGC